MNMDKLESQINNAIDDVIDETKFPHPGFMKLKLKQAIRKVLLEMEEEDASVS